MTLLSVWGSNWLFIFAQTSIQWPDKCYLSEAQFGCLYFVAVINSRLGLHWPTKPPKQKPNAAFKCNSSSVCLYNHNCACYLYFKPKWNQNETSILWWFQKFTTKQVFGEGCWVSLVVSLRDEECLQLVCYGHWPYWPLVMSWQDLMDLSIARRSSEIISAHRAAKILVL